MNKSFNKLKFISLIALVLLSLSCSLTVQETTGDITIPLPSSRDATISTFTITLENYKGEVKSYETNKTSITIPKIKVGKYTLHIKGTDGFNKYSTPKDGIEINIRKGKNNKFAIGLDIEEVIPPSSLEISLINPNDYVTFAEPIDMSKLSVIGTYANGLKKKITNFDDYIITPEIVTDDSFTTTTNDIVVTVTNKRNKQATDTINILCKYKLGTPEVSLNNHEDAYLSTAEQKVIIAQVNVPTAPKGSYSISYEWFVDGKSVGAPTQNANRYTISATNYQEQKLNLSCNVITTPLNQSSCIDNNVPHENKDSINVVIYKYNPNAIHNFKGLQDAINSAYDSQSFTVQGNFEFTEPLIINKQVTIKSNGIAMFKRAPGFTDNLIVIRGGPVKIGTTGDVDNAFVIDGNSSVVQNCNSLINVCQGVTLNLENVILQNNHDSLSQHGGGAILSTGNLNLTNCKLQNNSTTKSGGALFIGNGTNNFTNITLKNNTAKIKGGALAMHGTPTTIEINNKPNFDISYNKVTSTNGYGGGIYQGSGTLKLKGDTVIKNNTVPKQIGNGMNVYISTTKDVASNFNDYSIKIAKAFDSSVDVTTRP